MTSVGYGDTFATSDLERIVTMFIILMGDALLDFGFGMIASVAMINV